MLRCFNDCWAAGALFLAIYLFQKRHWAYGAMVFSAGIGVKMSLLVALPAVAVLLYQAKGPQGALTIGMYMAQVQVCLVKTKPSSDECQYGRQLAEADST